MGARRWPALALAVALAPTLPQTASAGFYDFLSDMLHAEAPRSSSPSAAASSHGVEGLRSLVQGDGENGSDALGGNGSTGNVTTRPPPPSYYDDFEPANCIVGSNCSQGGIPAVRGLCVYSTTAPEACWDVCNPTHAPMDYNTQPPNAQNSAKMLSVVGMIESVRAGLNPLVRCPPNLFSADQCSPGDFCGEEMLKRFKVPEGRGVCVVDANSPGSRSCWDVCDTSRSPVDFTMGTPEGTAAKVAGLRAGNVCPGIRWWQILLAVLGGLMLVACCIAVVMALRNRTGKKRSRGTAPLEPSRYEPEPLEYKSDFPEASSQPMVMEAGERAKDMHDFPAIPEDYAAQDYAADMMPPEPPREEQYGAPPPPPMPMAPMSQMEPQYGAPQEYAPAVSNMYPMEPLLSPHPHPPSQQQTPFEPFTYGGGSGALPMAASLPSPSGAPHRPIPGLDEPNLLLANLNILNGQVGADPFLGTPAAHQQFMLGTTHTVTPQMMQPSSFGIGTNPALAPQFQPSFHTVAPSFHTQLPQVYMASPPQSTHFAAGQQWYAQPQRR